MPNGEVETPGTEPTPEPPVAQPPPARPAWRRLWPWALVVVLLAAAVGSAIGISMGGRQGGPLANQGAGSGRPTIIVATAAAPSPSAFASPSSVAVVSASPTVAGASRTYLVQPGDTLRSIAAEQYGDASVWPRIYDANRDVIGADPDALQAGMTLVLPAL